MTSFVTLNVLNNVSVGSNATVAGNMYVADNVSIGGNLYANNVTISGGGGGGSVNSISSANASITVTGGTGPNVTLTYTGLSGLTAANAGTNISITGTATNPVISATGGGGGGGNFSTPTNVDLDMNSHVISNVSAMNVLHTLSTSSLNVVNNLSVNTINGVTYAPGGVTSISAGSGISVNTSTGNVVITATGGGGGGGNFSTPTNVDLDMNSRVISNVSAMNVLHTLSTSSLNVVNNLSVNTINGVTYAPGGVTSISAGSGISVNTSTGNVVITATGGGGGGFANPATVDLDMSYHNINNGGVIQSSTLSGAFARMTTAGTYTGFYCSMSAELQSTAGAVAPTFGLWQTLGSNGFYSNIIGVSGVSVTNNASVGTFIDANIQNSSGNLVSYGVVNAGYCVAYQDGSSTAALSRDVNGLRVTRNGQPTLDIENLTPGIAKYKANNHAFYPVNGESNGVVVDVYGTLNVSGEISVRSNPAQLQSATNTGGAFARMATSDSYTGFYCSMSEGVVPNLRLWQTLVGGIYSNFIGASGLTIASPNGDAPTVVDVNGLLRVNTFPIGYEIAYTTPGTHYFPAITLSQPYMIRYHNAGGGGGGSAGASGFTGNGGGGGGGSGFVRKGTYPLSNGTNLGNTANYYISIGAGGAGGSSGAGGAGTESSIVVNSITVVSASGGNAGTAGAGNTGGIGGNGYCGGGGGGSSSGGGGGSGYLSANYAQYNGTSGTNTASGRGGFPLDSVAATAGAPGNLVNGYFGGGGGGGLNGGRGADGNSVGSGSNAVAGTLGGGGGGGGATSNVGDPQSTGGAGGAGYCIIELIPAY